MGFTLVTICVMLCTIGPAMVSAYEVFFSISYSNSTFPGLKGSTATLTCQGVLEEEGERHYRMYFYKGDTSNTMWYYNIGSTSIYYYSSYWDNDRMSSLPVDSSSTGVTFNITNLDCTDEYKFICRALYYPANSNSRVYYPDREQTLSLMVEPMEPIFVAFPSLSNDADEVLEHTELTVYCSAVTGSPMKGSLHWRIYRDGIPEDIDDPWSDSRVVMTKGVTNCEETYESTLTLDMSRTYQKVAVACFVINEDFRPRSDLPSSCLEEPILCNQTRELLVLYGVSESAMTITSDLKDRLTCQADSYPPASLAWTRDDQTLPGVDDGQGVNTLILENTDSGIYTCTAINDVNGTIYSASKDVYIFLPAEDSGNSSTIAIAVGVASLVIIVVLVVAVVYLYKANKKRKDTAQGSLGTFGQSTATEQTRTQAKNKEDAAARYTIPPPPPRPNHKNNTPAKPDPAKQSGLSLPREAKAASNTRGPLNQDGPEDDYVNTGEEEEEDEGLYEVPDDPTVMSPFRH